MLHLRRAGWSAVAVVLLGLATTAFPQRPGRRPPPRPVTPPTFRPPSLPSFRPPPAQVKAGIEQAIRARPSTGLAHLRTPDALQLPQAVRLTLAREAVRQLAVKLELGAELVKTLSEVRIARLNANDLQPEVRASLERLGIQAERRILAESLQDVQFRAEHGKWAEAVEKAGHWLDQFERAQLKTTDHTEVRETLTEVRALGQRVEVLGRLEGSLRSLDSQKPADAARALGPIAPDQLPPSLRPPLSRPCAAWLN